MRKWFHSASSAFGSLSLPSSPSASTQEQSGLCQYREMTSGEGRVLPGAPQPTGHLLCPHIRACGWKRLGGWLCLGHLPGLTFPCLSFSLAILQCSVLIFALSPFGFFLCLFLTLLLHGFIPTLATLCFPFSCCCVRAERSCELKAQEQRHLIR